MFKLTQNKRDKELLELVAKFLNCGAVYSHGENAFDFTVSNFADNQNIIIPMFKTYPTFASLASGAALAFVVL